MQEEEDKIKEALFLSSSPSPTKQEAATALHNQDVDQSSDAQDQDPELEPAGERTSPTESQTPRQPEEDSRTAVEAASNAEKAALEEHIEQPDGEQEKHDEEKEKEEEGQEVDYQTEEKLKSTHSNIVALNLPDVTEDSVAEPSCMNSSPPQADPLEKREVAEASRGTSLAEEQMDVVVEIHTAGEVSVASEARMAPDAAVEAPCENASEETSGGSLEHAVDRLLGLSEGGLAALGREDLVAAVRSVNSEQSRLVARQNKLAELMTKICNAMTKL